MIFNNETELDRELAKTRTAEAAKSIALELEARLAPSFWIRKAYERYFELIDRSDKSE